jgi:hypothetical protein
MTCRQQQTYAGQTPFSGSHATEADCLAACKEGACCEGTTCSVKPQCQCQGTGKVFKGVGTTCESVSGACCNGDSCAIVNECECQGSGKVFKGVGTTCATVLCRCICGTNFGNPPCTGFSIPAQYKVTISGLDPLFERFNGVWILDYTSNRIDDNGEVGFYQYLAPNAPPGYSVRLGLACSSDGESLRYNYIQSVVSFLTARTAYAPGDIDATQPCQGQTLTGSHTAVVECIPNPLP